MKKSIAFLGALLFGSVTFGQVTKNDSIKKPSSRKVSADDMKKFPEDAETVSNPDYIKLESTQKHIKYTRTEKHASDASAGKGAKIKGSVTQKGKDGIIITEKMGGDGKATTTEKQHYTVKLTNANAANINFKEKSDDTESGVIKEGATTTQKKHVSNIKWSGDKVAEDPKPTPTPATTDTFLKITDVKGEKE